MFLAIFSFSDWPTWAIWLCFAAFFLIVEILTVNLVSIWFVVGSLAAALLSAMGFGVVSQILVFLLLSSALFGLFWRFRARLRIRPDTIEATNADRILNQVGVVTTEIDPIQQVGQIHVMGQMWSALSQNQQMLPKGTRVRVIALRGVRAVVVPISSDL